ncbi:chorismate-binding protein [Flavobacterium sp.]|uniref:chorismate-binding protein n=1 Tax=Flavobacterium sp. TaxID=239 RepID=UPI0026280968|nr:chorismate-binding protein [Flavobacterium sp.]
MINQPLIDCFQEAIATKENFAFWRYPKESSISFVSNLKENDRFSDEKAAFYFQRFAPDSNSVYLYDSGLVRKFELESAIFSAADIAFTSEDRSVFETQVEQGIKRISEGRLSKIVLSRKVSTEIDLNLIDSYIHMCLTYPAAFCYLFYTAEIGFWMGASPELFCEVSDGIATSMSLAGTRFATKYQPFLDKEFREQELVTQFISSKLADLVYRVRVSDRTEIQAGNLIHLQTIISGRLLEHATLNQLIAALHPTPAVCGLPQQKAFQAISEIEKYDRSFYTGVVGVVNGVQPNKINARLYVNLRCMNYRDKQTTLYAGCGIVADSNPPAEFEETEQKFKTIKRILVANNS